jgi:hypothetical protein
VPSQKTSGADADCTARLACLDVADGRVTADGIKVGTGGSGTLRIGPAGRVTGSSGIVAASGELSDGEIQVLGPSAEPQLVTTETGLALGTALDARGVLSLEGGARASLSGTSQVGASTESSGLIELKDGSVLEVAGASAALELGVDVPGEVESPTGELVFTNGRLELASSALSVRRTGRVSGAGEIVGSGLANSVTNDGVIGCGVSISSIYLQGPNGVLECALASPPAAPLLNPLSATRFARAVRARRPTPPPPPPGPFVVDGDATLAGTLVLQFLNGFAPSKDDVFELLDVSGNVTGGFATVAVRGLAPGAEFAQDFVGGKLTLTSLSDAESLPVVSVKAKTRTRESRSKKGLKVKFTRKGDKSQPLVLRYVLRGSARNGVDYEELPGVLEMPAGKRSAKLVLRALPDGLAESSESVSIELVPGESYTTSLFSRTDVSIEDEKTKKKR